MILNTQEIHSIEIRPVTQKRKEEFITKFQINIKMKPEIEPESVILSFQDYNLARSFLQQVTEEMQKHEQVN